MGSMFCFKPQESFGISQLKRKEDLEAEVSLCLSKSQYGGCSCIVETPHLFNAHWTSH